MQVALGHARLVVVFAVVVFFDIAWGLPCFFGSAVGILTFFAVDALAYGAAALCGAQGHGNCGNTACNGGFFYDFL